MGEALPLEPGLGSKQGTVAWPRGSGEIVTGTTDPQYDSGIFAPVYEIQRPQAGAEEPFITGQNEAFASQGFIGSASNKRAHRYGSAYLPAP